MYLNFDKTFIGVKADASRILLCLRILKKNIHLKRVFSPILEGVFFEFFWILAIYSQALLGLAWMVETWEPSMSFYPEFILILSRFYLDFLLILSKFYPDFIQIFLKTHFIQILSRYYSPMHKKNRINYVQKLYSWKVQVATK